MDPVDALNEIAYWLERGLASSYKTKAFRHAAEAGECVVSALDGPDDAERASRVRGLWRV